MDFTPFPKIPRLSREMVVTEKIDGTNASVLVRPGDGSDLVFGTDTQVEVNGQSFLVRAGSRTRWITISDDNHGFARWVYDHAHELARLGEGHHFGEWWGRGIQRGYGLSEKRFSLFNVGRWYDQHEPGANAADLEPAPSCCHVVPELLRGPFGTEAVDIALQLLRERGSYAAPGFKNPEGVVVWHEASRQMFKKTIEKDEQPKGRRVAACA